MSRTSSAQRDVQVLIVGGGITGLSATYALACEGKRPVLIERDTIGSGSTGRSAGILTLSQEEDVAAMRDTDARFFTDSYHALLSVIRSERIACGLKKTGATYLAMTSKDIPRLRDEHMSLPGSRLVLRPEKLPGRPAAALFEQEAYRLEPLRLTREFRRLAIARGARIEERTTLLRIQGNVAYTSRGAIRFDRLIDTRGNRRNTLTITTDLAIVRASRNQIKELNGRVFWTSESFEYAYGVPLSATTVLIGGTTRLGTHNTPDKKRLSRLIHNFFPGSHIVRMWCGHISLTPSTLPIIERNGEIISVSAVCGLAAGYAAGIRAAACAMGKNEILRPGTWPYDLFAIPGAKTLGTWWLHRRSEI